MELHILSLSLTFLLLFADNSRAQCPISGCDGLRSFSSTASDGESLQEEAETPPRLLWSYETRGLSGAGCVTDGDGKSGVVVCPMEIGQNVSVVSFAAENGSVLWTLSLTSQTVLPLLSYDGESVVSDGETLYWLARDGRSLAPPVTLYPTQGSLFDLTITRSTSIVTMLYKCGFVSTYTVDGVPISGLWLNDTVDEVDGTFIPLANPVMNDTHLYIISAFRPHERCEKQNLEKSLTIYLRLYAINVAAALDRKFTILWTFNKTVRGMIPYINSPVTFCSFVPPRSNHEDKYRGVPHLIGRLKSSDTMPGVLTMLGGRILGSISIQDESRDDLSFNISVRDLGTNFSVISSGLSKNHLTSLSWSNPDKVLKYNRIGDRFWALLLFPQDNKTILEELIEMDGLPLSSLTLNTLVTTPVTLLDIPTSDKLLVFATNSEVSSGRTKVKDTVPQFVGVIMNGSRGGREGAALSVKWSVPLPGSQPAHGQISSLSLSSGTVLYVTTPLGVYAYQLT